MATRPARSSYSVRSRGSPSSSTISTWPPWAEWAAGYALINLGETGAGVALLDELLVAVTTNEVSPINVGIVYCASIEAFQTIFDLRRAQEWTAVLDRWCNAQPDSVQFRGRCLLYRTELLTFHGQWVDAVDEARRARDFLSRPPPEPAVGEAHYQQAELSRLQGDWPEAERGYRDGSKWGRRPDPGLALLRLAQGDADAALAMIRRAVEESDATSRPKLLGPYVEILVAADRAEEAGTIAAELGRLAAASSSAWLGAISARSDGLVRLASGDPGGALASFRRASQLWQTLDAPHEAARTRVGIARACRALGDAETAALELAAARETFVELGAAPDVAAVDALSGDPPPRPGGLSVREIEVLQLLAGGETNREIATELGISERTVDRHVSNIYTKIDVSTRAAATAFAYEQGIVKH